MDTFRNHGKKIIAGIVVLFVILLLLGGHQAHDKLWRWSGCTPTERAP